MAIDLTTRFPVIENPTNKRPSLRLRFLAMRQVARERRQLAELDDRSLRDIGIDRQEAIKESSRTAWDLPQRLR